MRGVCAAGPAKRRAVEFQPSRCMEVTEGVCDIICADICAWNGQQLVLLEMSVYCGLYC